MSLGNSKLKPISHIQINQTVLKAYEPKVALMRKELLHMFSWSPEAEITHNPSLKNICPKKHAIPKHLQFPTKEKKPKSKQGGRKYLLKNLRQNVFTDPRSESQQNVRLLMRFCSHGACVLFWHGRAERTLKSQLYFIRFFTRWRAQEMNTEKIILPATFVPVLFSDESRSVRISRKRLQCCVWKHKREKLYMS